MNFVNTNVSFVNNKITAGIKLKMAEATPITPRTQLPRCKFNF